jgi:hypothetical protein
MAQTMGGIQARWRFMGCCMVFSPSRFWHDGKGVSPTV